MAALAVLGGALRSYNDVGNTGPESNQVTSGCWPRTASFTTRLMLRMILAWSAASHLACAFPRQRILTDAGVPGQQAPPEEELEEMFPFEPLWEFILPITGLSVGAFGVQLTLGLSLAEPLLLLVLPNTRWALRGWHDRLLSWHLGGLFGHPMVLAQLAAARAEMSQHQTEEAYRESSGTAAIGSLVGVYAIGALMGSALRRGVSEFGDNISHLRCAVILLLVVFNLHAVVTNGEHLGAHHAHAHAHATEERDVDAGESASSSHRAQERTPLLPAVKPNWITYFGIIYYRSVGCAAWFLGKSREAWQLLVQELTKVMQTAYSSRDILAARSLLVFGLTIMVSTAPYPRFDIFQGTLLRYGFNVTWFDIANVITAGIVIPFVVTSPWRLRMSQCLEACYYVTIMACLLAFVAFALSDGSFLTVAENVKDQFVEAVHLAMFAGVMLSVCTAVANAVLAVRTVKRTLPDAGATAVALGWSLLGSSLAQVAGVHVGGVIFKHASWGGVVLAAGVACTISLWAATETEMSK